MSFTLGTQSIKFKNKIYQISRFLTFQDNLYSGIQSTLHFILLSQYENRKYDENKIDVFYIL